MEQENQIALIVLNQLYENMYQTDEYDYETVDTFYAFLGYELALEPELQKMGINCTSELQDALLGINT